MIVGVNTMDTDVAKYSKERFDEVQAEMKLTLVRVGWKKETVEQSIPILPLSGWLGDNLISKSEKMPWWNGVDVIAADGTKVHVETLKQALNDFVKQPARQLDKPMRMPVSGLYNIKGIGQILTGRIEQGTVSPGDEVLFLPTHTTANKCQGKVFSIEMHHKPVKKAVPGDNVGLNMKNLNKDNMPRTGDVMILAKDDTLKVCSKFVAQVQVLDVPNEVKVKYCPTIFVRNGHSSCRLTAINWKIGKETLGKKAEEPHSIKSNEMAEVVFEPIQPLVVDVFENCEGLSRLAVMEGNGVVMLGKCIKVEAADPAAVAKDAAKKK